MRSCFRRLLLFTLVIVGVVSATGVWLLWPHSAITLQNFEKIRPGMTLGEVETILGGTARDDSNGPVTCGVPTTKGFWDQKEHWTIPVRGRVVDGAWIWDPPPQQWISDTVLIWVWLDAEERVTSFDSVPVRRMRENPFDRLRRRFGL